MGERDTADVPVLRVLIVDDHAVVRHGLEMLVNAERDMQVVGQAGGGLEALQMARSHTPDIVLMDVSMSEGDGVSATEQIRRTCPNVRVIALSRHNDPGYARRMFEAGGTGYVVKKTSAAELLHAIRAVARGGTYLDSNMTPVATPFGVTLNLSTGAGAGALSNRESEVMRQIARGQSNKEIAATLGVSIKTIESHKARACAKLELHSRADIVKFAIREGWLDD